MNALQKYFNYRQALIDQYMKGDMTKREYLERNLDAVLSLNIKPFKNVDTVDKALFNYQYYNAMAKDAKINTTGNTDREYEHILLERSNYFYSQKDRATMRVLQLYDFTNVSAYFIKVKSKYLRNKLFEIILEDTNTVLHSSNQSILNRLKEERVFSEGVKRSVIDSYINQRYY
ncbi:MAG: DUF6648 family protein [Lachnospirales bacterium]